MKNTVLDFSTVGRTAKKRHFVVFFATKTSEKVAQYNASARLQKLPITFINLNEVTEFHSVDEEKGNRVEHALDKIREVDSIVELIQYSPDHKAVVQTLLASMGIPYEEANIAFAAEDSWNGLSRKQWKRSKKPFARFLPKDIIANAEKDGTKHLGKKYLGPGTEIGPTLGAAGVEAFINAATHGMEKGEHTECLDAVTMVVRGLHSDKASSEKIITKFQKSIIIKDETPPYNNIWLYSTADYLRDTPPPYLTRTETEEANLRTNSARAQIVGELYQHLLAAPYVKSHAISVIAPPKQKPVQIRLMTATPIPKIASFPKRTKGLAGPAAKVTSPYLPYIDLSRNFTTSSDAFVFGPFDNGCASSLYRPAYAFFSTLDQKIVGTDSMNKPIIVVDNGSYSSIMRATRYLVNTGMAKDYERRTVYEENPAPILNSALGNVSGIKHKAFGLFDYVAPVNEGGGVYITRLFNAASQVLLRRSREYRRYIGLSRSLVPGPSAGNAPYRNDIFKVAVFTSASNDNRILLEHNDGISRGIARIGAGFVWGAGDRHGMGAAYNGYRDEGGIWTEGYSTSPILIAETKRGHMPQCSYSEISPHIYERMAKMIEASNVITITPGGFGTVEEMLAVFILMKEAPQLMGNKSVIIHNPVLYGDTPFWTPILESFLEANELRQLTTHGKIRGRNMFMTSTVAEHDKLIGTLKEEWETNQRPSQTRSCNKGGQYNAA